MKTCKCVGCGALIPVDESVVDPFYTTEVLCPVCVREWEEDEESRREDQDRVEVERVCRESRWMWD